MHFLFVTSSHCNLSITYYCCQGVPTFAVIDNEDASTDASMTADKPKRLGLEVYYTIPMHSY